MNRTLAIARIIFVELPACFLILMIFPICEAAREWFETVLCTIEFSIQECHEQWMEALKKDMAAPKQGEQIQSAPSDQQIDQLVEDVYAARNEQPQQEGR